MNSGPTSERVYAALKRLILDRRFRPGERLDPARLGDALSSSVTPVRDALHILTGEGLVESRTGEGFQLPLIDEPGLKDLYAWNNQLLILATRTWSKSPAAAGPAGDVTGEDQAARTACLFGTIAGRSSNAEHRPAIARLNERLHGIRQAEELHLSDIEAELSAIRSTFEAEDLRLLRKQLTVFHRRRTSIAAETVRSLYRGE